MEQLTSKQKLDSLLGIKDDQTIDNYLDSLELDTQQISSTFESIDQNVKDNLQSIDSKITQLQKNPATSMLQLKDLDTSMKEVEDLVSLSKKMFKHIYENVCSSDLLDSELIGSAAKLLESIHDNIAEFTTVYREKQQFIDKIKLMIFSQEQKKELMHLKHEYDLERIKAVKKQEKVEEAEELHAYSQEEIVKMLSDLEKNDRREQQEE